MLFALGQTVITPKALSVLEEHNVSARGLLQKHGTLDRGYLNNEDFALNKLAIIENTRVFSEYMVGDEKVWVITEADRSSTTILLPSEY